MLKTSGYKSILKGTAIFGSVQVFNIFISLVRGKLVALFLGPFGLGISTLLSSSVSMIQRCSEMGINLSAIRNIAEANSAENREQLTKVIKIFRRLLIFSAILGAIILIILSPYLSRLAFNSDDYTWSFIALSLSLTFTSLADGESSILQGCRRLKNLATATLVGSFLGLVTGVPLYMIYGVKGIVPAMIILPVSSYFTNRFFSSKIDINQRIFVCKSEFWATSKNMLSLGVVSMISGLLGTVTTYVINMFVTNVGNITDVGYYQAATSITNQYVGLVFSAMAMDYFPRLSVACSNISSLRELVNQQSAIVSLITTPLIILLILSTPLVIHVLLSKEFISVIPLVRWMGLGLLFKAGAYALGYISFAKGDKKLFFFLEGIYSNLAQLLLSIGLFMIWGLTGLGISFCISSFLYYLLINWVALKRYNFKYDQENYLIFPISALACSSVFILSIFMSSWMFYICGIIIFLIYMIYVWNCLEKRMEISTIIKKLFSK